VVLGAKSAIYDCFVCTAQDQLSAPMSKREMCAKELLATEKNYVEVLQLIVNVSLYSLLSVFWLRYVLIPTALPWEIINHLHLSNF